MSARHPVHASRQPQSARSKRATRWPKEEYVRRVEYDAKNDALLQTIRADIAVMRSEVRIEISTMRSEMRTEVSGLKGDIKGLKGEIEGVKGHLEGVKTSINLIIGVLAILAGMGVLQLHPAIRALSAGTQGHTALAMRVAPGPSTPASAP